MAFKMTDGTRLELPNNKKAAARYVADMISNRGTLPDTEEMVTWNEFVNVISPKNRDAISSSEISPLLQQSMEILIREPVEPRMVITPLFSRVQAKGLNTQILTGAMGAVYASDVQESGTYPEVNFQMGGAVSTAYIGKSGIAASFTDEALRYSTFDIMAKNLELMGNAMVRHKEQKAVAFLKQLGTALFDNLQPSSSLYGVCSGRGVKEDGAGVPKLTANGSMTMENLMRGMAHMAEEGFSPDTLLMHPLFYYTFLQDPVLKTMMLAHGGGSIFNMYTGDPGSQDPWSNGALGGRGLFGVELFIKGDDVLFSEVSPRPHDTGMVTLISQDLSEFALHSRAILGLSIPAIRFYGASASAVLLVEGKSAQASFGNLRAATAVEDTSIRLFGKPEVTGKRRMGVALARGATTGEAVKKALAVAAAIDVTL